MKALNMTDTKHAADVISVGAALGSLAGWLPAVAAAASLVWTLIRIYETKTMQGWVKKWRKRK